MRIAVIFGTRPEAVKLAPVIFALKRKQGLECRVCVTGQHRKMLDQMLTDFGISPDVDLGIMQPDQSLVGLTVRAIETVDDYLKKDNPDLVLVQGDTTTVFCAALAAFYNHIPIGHVEAGLRTGDLQSPWPEEANRVLTSRLAALHFAPTESARQNLLREGIPARAVTVTGNTVIDALFLALKKVRKDPPAIPGLPRFLQPARSPGNHAPRLVLITGHRRENFGEGFENICRAIAGLARQFRDVHFVYPVHLNPNVREPVMRILGGGKNLQAAGSPPFPALAGGNVHLIDPVPYFDFVGLMDRAELILTDSGGVQEEAPSLGKPVLVMRDVTERPEALAAGTVRLVGTSRELILSEVSRLLNDRSFYEKMSRAHNPYGDGKAAGRIVRTVCRRLGTDPPAQC